ncbi:MAG: acetyl-CoA carboxylase, carboxyltransferase subunit beta [candidate division KSB1 bacterium]|nr:acetyl-CoA carboxylase, carboxyltransferase subunit beta [candidate division KSB1 bacterium]
MAWFKRVKTNLLSQKKKDIPDGLWIKCKKCGEVLYKNELERNLDVCNYCGYHFRITNDKYINLLTDKDSFEEFNSSMRSMDPLKFRDTERYADRLKKAMNKTGMNDAVRTGTALIHNLPVVLAVMDFHFIGGSMGSVVGEKIARAIDVALERRQPFIAICASGGARMQESAYSLMQMAKTSSRLAKLSQAGLPYISILTHPTTGGVTASYASLGDVILAEPEALIAFAGPRVIKQTIGQDLPEGFQRSEFMQKHGFVDAIVPRNELRDAVTQLLNFFLDPQTF